MLIWGHLEMRLAQQCARVQGVIVHERVRLVEAHVLHHVVAQVVHVQRLDFGSRGVLAEHDGAVGQPVIFDEERLGFLELRVVARVHLELHHRLGAMSMSARSSEMEMLQRVHRRRLGPSGDAHGKDIVAPVEQLRRVHDALQKPAREEVVGVGGDGAADVALCDAHLVSQGVFESFAKS